MAIAAARAELARKPRSPASQHRAVLA
jgi:hypothetical protein